MFRNKAKKSVNFGWIDGNLSLNRSQILKFEKFWTPIGIRIQKIWSRNAVVFGKSDSLRPPLFLTCNATVILT